MSAPLSRDLQIKLMKEAQSRHKAHMTRWMSDSMIRELIAEPAKGQKNESHYMRTDKRIACC